MHRVLGMSVLVVGLVLAFLLVGQAQPLVVLQGKVLTQDGKPVTKQPFVIEGLQESRWIMKWMPFEGLEAKKVRVISVTDERGAFQVLNLPAGHYWLKLLRVGAEPVLVKEFKLDPGYDKKEIIGSVAISQLWRDSP